MIKTGGVAHSEARAASSEEFPPMYVAAAHGRIDIMRELLRKRADPNKLNSKQQSPLMVAVALGQMEAAKFLVSAGADPFLVNSWGRTALNIPMRGPEFHAILTQLGYALTADQRTPKHWGTHGDPFPTMPSPDCAFSDKRALPWLPPQLQRCDAVLLQGAELRTYFRWLERLQELRNQYNAAAETMPRDLPTSAALGKQLGAHLQQREKLVVTEEEVAAYHKKHAEVVEEVVARCDELAASGAGAELHLLATKLVLLQAVDLSGLPATGESAVPTRAPARSSSGDAHAVTASVTAHWAARSASVLSGASDATGIEYNWDSSVEAHCGGLRNDVL